MGWELQVIYEHSSIHINRYSFLKGKSWIPTTCSGLMGSQVLLTKGKLHLVNLIYIKTLIFFAHGILKDSELYFVDIKWMIPMCCAQSRHKFERNVRT